MTVPASRPSGLSHLTTRATTWARHVDTAVLALAAVAGVFLGLADTIFQPTMLAGRELGIAVALLGAIALHGILQRFISREIRDVVAHIQSDGHDLITLDSSHHSFGRATTDYVSVQNLKAELRENDVNPAYGRVADELVTQPFGILEALADGRVAVPADQVPTALKLVIDAFDSRFDAVSYDDLAFWYERGTLAMRYLHLNIASVRRKRSVTRLFIFHAHQLLDATLRARIAEVLSHQFSVGIGWGVAVYEDLEPGLPPGPLDFALHAGDKAVSTFRREGEGRFVTTFWTNGKMKRNDQRVHGLRALYDALLPEVWMATQRFTEIHLGSDNVELMGQLREDASLHNRRLQASAGKAPEHAIFPFLVKSIDEIVAKIDELAEIYEKYAARRL